MNKKSIIILLLALVAMAGQGQVRCYVIGTVAEETTPVELRIYRDGEDPKNSTLRPVLKNGRFECDVEDAQIERWHIVDFGEVMEKGMTLRSEEFFSEDGATVTIRLDGDKFDIQSTGKEYQAWHAMKQEAEAKFMPAYEKLNENDKQKMAELENGWRNWRTNTTNGRLTTTKPTRCSVSCSNSTGGSRAFISMTRALPLCLTFTTANTPRSILTTPCISVSPSKRLWVIRFADESTTTTMCAQ